MSVRGGGQQRWPGCCSFGLFPPGVSWSTLALAGQLAPLPAHRWTVQGKAGFSVHACCVPLRTGLTWEVKLLAPSSACGLCASIVLWAPGAWTVLGYSSLGQSFLGSPTARRLLSCDLTSGFVVPPLEVRFQSSQLGVPKKADCGAGLGDSMRCRIPSPTQP